MTQIRWLPLRLNIIPLIDKQVNKVLETFNQIRSEIMEGDILAVQRLIQLKKKVTDRLQDFDKFYTQNSMDSRTKYLFAARTILSKIASSNTEFSKINEDFHSVPWKNQSRISNKSPISAYQEDRTMKVSKKSVSPINRNLLNSSNRTPNSKKDSKILGNQRPKINSRSFYDKPDMQRQQQSSPQFKISGGNKPKDKYTTQSKLYIPKGQDTQIEKYSGKKGISKKMQHIGSQPKKNPSKKTEQMLQLEQEERRRKQKLDNSNIEIKKSYRDLSELVFTIKMTREEYSQFMKIKRKNHHA